MDKWAPALVANQNQAPLIYALMREEEKLERIRNLFEGANPGSETIEDTLKDLAIIPVIGLQLYRERIDIDEEHGEQCICTGCEPPKLKSKCDHRFIRTMRDLQSNSQYLVCDKCGEKLDPNNP